MSYLRPRGQFKGPSEAVTAAVARYFDGGRKNAPIEFSAILSVDERREKLSVLVTVFNKDFGDSLKAIKQGQSNGYTMSDDELKCSMFGKIYNKPFLEDVSVISDVVKFLWNEKSVDTDRLRSFQRAAHHLSGINYMTRMFIDLDGLDEVPSYPHEAILRKDIFMETERYSLRDMRR